MDSFHTKVGVKASLSNSEQKLRSLNLHVELATLWPYLRHLLVAAVILCQEQWKRVSRALPPSTVARKEVGNQAYPQFCSVVGNPTAPIRLQYLKGIDHTHSTVPRVNFAHVGLTERRGHPL